MSLYYPSTGLADPVKFGNTMRALDLAASVVLGSGVILGLTVSGAGLLSTGDALYGHVMTLAAPFDTTPLLVASAVNYVYLQQPPAPICPDINGKDAGQVIVNTSIILPPGAVMIASITTGAGAAILSVNNAPVGRRNLTLPLAALDLRFTGAYSGGATYQIGNVVSYQGGSYVALTINTGVVPAVGANWGQMSAPGATGAAGAPGASGSSTLSGDTDVALTSPADGDILTFSATAMKWVNRALSALGLSNLLPSACVAGQSGDAGVATTGCRADHVHAMPASFPPSTHAASHGAGGTDAVSPASIGAAATASNLADLASASAARANLGLGTAATLSAPASGNAASGQVVLGSDSRLTSAGVSLSGTTPAAETVGAAGSVGTAATAARADHVHALPSVFGASGSGHSSGFVPYPGASAGVTRFLREDGSWNAISGSAGDATTTVAGLVEVHANPGSGHPIVYLSSEVDALLSAESSSRSSADTAEATARASADTSESAARVSGDALALKSASNLSDLASSATARGNLGLGSAAVVNVPLSGNATSSQAVLGSDTRLAAAATALQKRRLQMPFAPSTPATPDTSPDISQVIRLPLGTGSASTFWKLTTAFLRTDNPASGATTVQFYYSAGGNAPFGSGTACLSSALTLSGGSSYEASTTSFTGTIGSTGLASGTLLAPEFTALGGGDVSLEIEWEEA